MEIVLLWILLSFVVAGIGSNRKIGFLGGLLASIVFSPIIGFLFTILSDRLEDEKFKKQVQSTQQKQNDALIKIANLEKAKTESVSDEIIKLNELRINKVISEEEFQKLKSKLLN
jgi:phosphate/sulfate permease